MCQLRLQRQLLLLIPQTRYFTVEEANALLPMLAPVLWQLRRVYEQIHDAMEKVRTFEARSTGNGHGGRAAAPPPDFDLDSIRADLSSRLEYLEAMGVQVKDIEHGIVDFPTRIAGRDAVLCWRLGEETIGYWHDLDSGFAGRQPL